MMFSACCVVCESAEFFFVDSLFSLCKRLLRSYKTSVGKYVPKIICFLLTPLRFCVVVDFSCGYFSAYFLKIWRAAFKYLNFLFFSLSRRQKQLRLFFFQ